MRLFANILKPDEVLSLSKGECLTQPFQMQLSQNQKIFSETFAGFPEFKWKLEYVEKEDEPQRSFLSKIIDRKEWVYLNT